MILFGLAGLPSLPLPFFSYGFSKMDFLEKYSYTAAGSGGSGGSSGSGSLGERGAHGAEAPSSFAGAKNALCLFLCQGVHFSVLAVRFLATSGTSKLARLPDFSLFFLLHHRQLHPAANSEVVGLKSNWSAGGACGVGCVLYGLLCHPRFADSDSTSDSTSSRSACTGPIGS